MIHVVKIIVVVSYLTPSCEHIANATLRAACIFYFLHRKTFHYDCDKAEGSNGHKESKENRPSISNDVIIDKQEIMCIVVA